LWNDDIFLDLIKMIYDPDMKQRKFILSCMKMAKLSEEERMDENNPDLIKFSLFLCLN